ncbi:MAG: 4-hydroxy-tetrahydrodipicolinate synthase [Kiritimatiellae bacterium]|nr:4-hydroxy-tetrahydrodipicolinate synthase [Kiritimatiellia bacterium]
MFNGTFTALVTPFNSDETVDYDALTKLIERQIDAGVDGVVPVGTTGESPTLSHDEHVDVIQCAVQTAAGRTKVIAGSGSNSTKEALTLTKKAVEAGVDGVLQITPYYNKPSQEGLFRHFTQLADLGAPVVLYNVPGRTSRQIDVSTIARLSEHPHVVAVKEAGGSVERVSEILDACDITVLSGDDGLAFPMIAVGATGVISVASNVAPKHVCDMVRAAREGKMDDARQIHSLLYPLFRDLFIDTNPIPVKAAMAMMGLTPETYRLPLCELGDQARMQLRATLKALDLV